MAWTKEQRREWAREWIRKRRDDWIRANGPCARCGSWDNPEVDHIDPSTKVFETREIWSRRAEVREAELAKCQVLCHDCHLDKSRAEGSLSRRKTTDRCRRGHLYAVAGIRWNPNGTKKCGECARISARRRWAENKQRAA